MTAFWFITMFVVFFMTRDTGLEWLTLIPMAGFAYQIFRDD